MDLRPGRILRTHRRRQQDSQIALPRVGGEDMKSISDISGVGLRLPHLTEMVATLPPTGWLEVHPENFLANPHAAELLTELSTHYPISFHTVGISVGSVCGIDRLHLKRLRSLIDRIYPIFISGHLAWSTYGNDY